MPHSLANLPNRYARDIEISYISSTEMRAFVANQSHPTLYPGEKEVLQWQEHRSNWLFERWTLRAYQKPYFGPNPRTLIDPISAQEVIQALCERLKDWEEWAMDDDDPDWELSNSHKLYFVETMSLAFYTLETGKLASKSVSVC